MQRARKSNEAKKRKRAAEAAAEEAGPSAAPLPVAAAVAARSSIALHNVASVLGHTERPARAPAADFAVLLLLCLLYIAVGPVLPGPAITQLLVEKLERLRPLAAGFQKNSDLRQPQYCSACKVRLALEGWQVSGLGGTDCAYAVCVTLCLMLRVNESLASNAEA